MFTLFVSSNLFFCSIIIYVVTFILIYKKLNLVLKKLEDLMPNNLKLSITIFGKKVDKMVLKVNQKLPMSLVLEDKFDNVITADVAPVWSLTDENAGQLVVAEGALAAEFIPSGRLGQVTVQAVVEVEGKQILGSLVLDLVAGDVAEVVLQAGAPVTVE